MSARLSTFLAEYPVSAWIGPSINEEQARQVFLRTLQATSRLSGFLPDNSESGYYDTQEELENLQGNAAAFFAYILTQPEYHHQLPREFLRPDNQETLMRMACHSSLGVLLADTFDNPDEATSVQDQIGCIEQFLADMNAVNATPSIGEGAGDQLA